MIGLHKLVEDVRALVRRPHLIRRHTAECGVCPVRHVAGLGIVVVDILVEAGAGGVVTLVENFSARHGHEEIGH